MVKQLTKTDNEQVMVFLNQETEFNIFIIGDIEQFGYDSDFQTVWGEYEQDELVAVLLQYKTNVVYYAPKERSIDPFKEVLEGFEYDILNGKKEVIEVFEDYLNEWNIKDMYFCSLTKFEKEDIDTSDVIRLMTYEDFASAHDLLSTILSFLKEKRRNLMQNISLN